MDTSEILKLIPDELKLFFRSILDEADVFIADEKDLQEIIISMYGHFNNFILSAILEHLPEDKIDDFVVITEENNSTTQEAQNYLEQNLPNAKDIISKAYEEFRNLYLETIAIADERMEAMDKNKKEDATINIIQDLAKGKYPDNNPK